MLFPSTSDHSQTRVSKKGGAVPCGGFRMGMDPSYEILGLNFLILLNVFLMPLETFMKNFGK